MGYLKDYYTLKNPTGIAGNTSTQALDEGWKVGEIDLPRALDQLIKSNTCQLDAKLWAITLATFVAQRFVRSPAFEYRYNARFNAMFGENWSSKLLLTEDNTNWSRTFDLFRILWKIIKMEWTVLRNYSLWPFITTDVAWMPIRHPKTQQRGYVIPLRFDAILIVSLGPNNPKIYSNGSDWIVTGVQHMYSEIPAAIQEINQIVAYSAWKEVYGPSEKAVIGSLKGMSIHQKPNRDPELLIDKAVPFHLAQDKYFHLLAKILSPPTQ